MNSSNNKLKLITAFLLLVLTIGVTGCSKGKDVSINDIYEGVKAAYKDSYYPNMTYDEAAVKDLFGISEDMYDEIIAEGPMISASVDTFIAVKASKGKADSVEEALNSYRDYLINDTMQYPSNQVKIQASSVVRYDDYVFFVMLGEIPAYAEEQGEEAILKAAQEQNQIGLDAIAEFFK